jgi:hypothetical protein
VDIIIVLLKQDYVFYHNDIEITILMAAGNSIELSTLRCHGFQDRLGSRPRYPPLIVQLKKIFSVSVCSILKERLYVNFIDDV